MQRCGACRIGKEQACDENAVRTAAYWEVERQAGETREDFLARAGRIYFEAQQQETAEWWRRIGVQVDLRGLRVLDIGCGHGALSADAARRGAAHVTGVDTDPQRIRFACRHVQDRYPDLAASVDFLSIPVAALPVEDSFDVVLSKDVFEHVQDLGGLLEETARRIKGGGLLVCGFSPLYYSPNGDHARYRLPLPWLHAWLPQSWVHGWASRRLGRHVRSAADVGLNRLTLREFERLLPAHAWERVSLRINPMEHPLRPAFDLLRRIRSLERYFTVGVYAVYRRIPSAGSDSLRTAGSSSPAANSDDVAAPAPREPTGVEGRAP